MTMIVDRTLKTFSLLLSYPEPPLQAAAEALAEQIEGDARLPGAVARRAAFFAEGLAAADLYALQEEYVALFDRSRRLSLNLFEHLHGESRDRGGAMVSLLETYHAAGLEPDTVELPDHLPVLLEFLALRPGDEARAVLEDCAQILGHLLAALAARESDYADLLAALVVLAGGDPDAWRTGSGAGAGSGAGSALPEAAMPAGAASLPGGARRDMAEDPAALAALDLEWEEPPVSFAGPAGQCPVARETLAQMDGGPAAQPRPERAPPALHDRHAGPARDRPPVRARPSVSDSPSAREFPPVLHDPDATRT